MFGRRFLSAGAVGVLVMAATIVGVTSAPIAVPPVAALDPALVDTEFGSPVVIGGAFGVRELVRVPGTDAMVAAVRLSRPTQVEAIVRLDETGAVDPSFGVDGVVEIAGSVNYLDVFDDGSVVYGGLASGWFVIGRLFPDGSPDLAWANAGTYSFRANEALCSTQRWLDDVGFNTDGTIWLAKRVYRFSSGSGCPPIGHTIEVLGASGSVSHIHSIPTTTYVFGAGDEQANLLLWGSNLGQYLLTGTPVQKLANGGRGAQTFLTRVPLNVVDMRLAGDRLYALVDNSDDSTLAFVHAFRQGPLGYEPDFSFSGDGVSDPIAISHLTDNASLDIDAFGNVHLVAVASSGERTYAVLDPVGETVVNRTWLATDVDQPIPGLTPIVVLDSQNRPVMLGMAGTDAVLTRLLPAPRRNGDPIADVDRLDMSDDGRFALEVTSTVVRHDLWSGSTLEVSFTGPEGDLLSVTGVDMDPSGSYVVAFGPTVASGGTEVGLFRYVFGAIDVERLDFGFPDVYSSVPLGGITSVVAGASGVAFSTTTATPAELDNGDVTIDDDVFFSPIDGYYAIGLTEGLGQYTSTPGFVTADQHVIVESTANLDHYNRLGETDNESDVDVFDVDARLFYGEALRLTSDEFGLELGDPGESVSSYFVAGGSAGDVLFLSASHDLACNDCQHPILYLREHATTAGNITIIRVTDGDTEVIPGLGSIDTDGTHIAWLEHTTPAPANGSVRLTVGARYGAGTPFLHQLERVNADSAQVYVTNGGRRVWYRSNGLYRVVSASAEPRFDRPLEELVGELQYSRVISDPVNVNTGSLIDSTVDLAAPAGAWGLDFTRTYDSARGESSMGPGWSNNWSAHLTFDGTVVTLHDNDGRPYEWDSTGTTQPAELGGRIEDVGVIYRVWFNDGHRWAFDREGRLTFVISGDGNTVEVQRDVDGRISALVSNTGASLEMAYDTLGRVASVTANDGRQATYTYDDLAGTLVHVDRPAGAVTYEYDAFDKVVGAFDATGVRLHQTVYDESGRVAEQLLADGQHAAFAYDDDMRTTTVTDLVSGEIVAYTFDALGRVTLITDPSGATVQTEFNADGKPTRVVDRNGVVTELTYGESGLLEGVVKDGRGSISFEHDEYGRVVTMTDAAGAITQYSYASPLDRLATDITDGLGNTTHYEISGGRVQSVTDPDGVTQFYGYDGQGRMGFVGNPAEVGGYDYAFDDRGHLAVLTDPVGATTTWSRDEAGRPLTVTAADGAIITYTYDDAGRLLSVTDPLGNTSTLAYNVAGLLEESTDSIGRSTTFQYDALGQLVATVLADGSVVSTGRGQMGRVDEVADPLGRATSMSYTATGQVQSVTSPDGATSDLGFDELGRPITMTGPTGREASVAYDSIGRLESAVAAGGGTTIYTYDLLGRVETATDPTGGVTSYTYTPGGRLASVSDPTGVEVRYVYNLAGRLAEVVNASGGSTLFEYDATGRRTSMSVDTGSQVQTQTWTYDAVGRVVGSVDANGITTTYTYTLRGQVESAMVAGEGETRYTYNADGTVATVTDPTGGVTSFGYDLLGRRTSRTAADGSTEHWEYDAAGQITAVVDQLGNRTTQTYDANGRIATATDPTGRSVTYAYNQAGDQTSATYSDGTAVTYTYDAAGRRASMTDATGTTTYLYDSAGRLLSVGSPNGTVSYTYDLAGRRTSITYPDGTTADYTYDDAGRLVGLAHPAAGLIEYTSDLAGNETSATFPHGQERTFAYEGWQLVGYTDLGSSYTIEYDATGRIAAIDGSESHTYTYDAAGQLTEATVEGQTFGYEYGTRGELQSILDDSGTRTITTGASGAPVSVASTSSARTGTLLYDAAGRLLSDTAVDGTVTTYTYDGRGLPTRITRTLPAGFVNPYPGATSDGDVARKVVEDRVYDGDGRLVRVTDQTYTLAPPRRTEDAPRRADPDAPATTRAFVWDTAAGLDQLLSVRSATDTNYLLGNRREAAIAGGMVTPQQYNPLGDNVTDGITYGPYGTPIEASPAATWGFGYRGELASPVGLQYLRARNYNPQTATFTSPDALDGVAGQTTVTNPYHYANNDPVNQEDPTGLRPTDDLFSGGVPIVGQADGCATLRNDLCVNLFGVVNPGQSAIDAMGHELAVQQANLCANSSDLIYWKVVDRVIEQTCRYWTSQVDSSEISVPKTYECSGSFDPATYLIQAALSVFDKCFSIEKGAEAVWDAKWDILKFAINTGTFGAFGCGYDTVGGLLNNDRGQAASGVIDCVTMGGASSAARAVDGVFARVLGGNTLSRLGIRQVVLGVEGELQTFAFTDLAQITINRDIGKLSERLVAAEVGGAAKSARTDLGMRYIDVVADSLAIEVKTGYQTLTDDIAQQIAKDAHILAGNKLGITEYEWWFRVNPLTGEGGASAELVALLESEGIRVRMFTL